jgi:SAM-dependent methyltransferase
MLRYEILNILARRIGATSYLEIGVQQGRTFSVVNVARKVGVDPSSAFATEHTTSDAYFETCAETFDLVFVDGLHTFEQARRDALNALRVLRPGGAVVLHDCDPPNAAYTSLDCCGTVFRAWLALRAAHPSAYLVDTDLGCGVLGGPPLPDLRRLEPTPPLAFDATWGEFNQNRDAWLGRISPGEFVEAMRS